MGCCTGFARFILILFNFIFWLSGAALLGIGIWIRVDPDIEEYQKVIEDASSDGDFLEIAAYICIGFGAFILLVGFCGCCGAIRNSKCLLGFYIFFLIIVFAGEIAAAVYVGVFRDEAEDDLEEGLMKSIKNNYGSNAVGRAWDELQKELDCCGGKDSMDYDGSDWANDNMPNKIPISCCVREYGNILDQDFCQSKNSTTYYHDKGCKAAIEDWIDDNSVIIIAVGASLAALQIIILIIAICYCRNMEKDD